MNPFVALYIFFVFRYLHLSSEASYHTPRVVLKNYAWIFSSLLVKFTSIVFVHVSFVHCFSFLLLNFTSLVFMQFNHDVCSYVFDAVTHWSRTSRCVAIAILYFEKLLNTLNTKTNIMANAIMHKAPAVIFSSISLLAAAVFVMISSLLNQPIAPKVRIFCT